MAEKPMKDEKCPECTGRGWHVGDCHPRETCGVCLGIGTTEVANMRSELRALRAVAEAALLHIDNAGRDDTYGAVVQALDAWRGLR